MNKDLSVQIAQDIIDRIQHGYPMRISTKHFCAGIIPHKIRDDIDIFHELDMHCQMCAAGCIIISVAKLTHEHSYLYRLITRQNAIAPVASGTRVAFHRHEFMQPLIDIFGHVQMALIETAFMCKDYRRPYTHIEKIPADGIIEAMTFGTKIQSPVARMLDIARNMVTNDGTFDINKPPPGYVDQFQI